MSKVIIGLAKIEVGAPVNGGVATTFETLGYTQKDSCEIDTEDPEETNIEAEEVDDPIETFAKGGPTTINFNVLDADETVFEKTMGGTKSTGVWESDNKLVTKELSMRITTKSGHKLTYPRTKFWAKIAGTVGDSEPLTLQCKAKVLIPTDGTTKKLKVEMPSDSGSGSGSGSGSAAASA